MAGGGLSEVGVAVGRAVRGRLGLKAGEGGYGGERACSAGLREPRAAHCRRPGAASLGQDSARQPSDLPSPLKSPIAFFQFWYQQTFCFVGLFCNLTLPVLHLDWVLKFE